MQLVFWITPDIPRKLKERIQQENYLVQVSQCAAAFTGWGGTPGVAGSTDQA